MSTTVATATTTTTTTVTSAGGTTSSTPTSSTATTSATSTPVSSTATSSTPTATPTTGAAAPGTPFATPFGPGGAPFVTPLPSCLMPESFTGSGDFEDYLQQFNTAALLSGWFSPSHDNRLHYFALRLQGNALHFYTTLSAAQQTDFNLLVDAFRQNYTTNVDILKARLKAGRQPNQDISAFLCDIRTLARRAYRAFPHLVEQIVLTSFIEGLSDATLRWELRKSKPATADDALALAMELNSFLEIEKGAPSTSKMAGTSVNAISRETPEPPTKEWMDELVRTLTDGIKNAMPKPSQAGSRQRNSTPNRNQSSRSNSADSQGARKVRLQNNSNERRNNSGRDNNRRGPNRLISTPNRPNSNQNSSKGPCKHCTRENHASNECKACFKCGKIGHFRNECRSNTPNNLY